ncbi:MAG: PP2C family protein-serine/threonine phosphatase, partial [Anaerolineales bacterium]
PDLVLLDVMMPEMDGFEVLKRMKADQNWRDIPVVIVSAMADMTSVVKGIELGADDYLPKPFDPAILNARINAGLSRKRLRDMEKIYLQSLERELEIGHQIQSGFLPQSLPDIPGWEMVAHFQAAREVAGDFYDVFHLPDGRIGLFLGDVTDKGVGAALFMALYRSLLRAFLNAESYISCAGGEQQPDEGPADYLLRSVCRTNDYVCRTHPSALFATLFSGVLDPASGELVYINAGHNPPLTFKDDQICRSLPPSGPAIGIQEWVDFEVRRIHLAPWEALLVYSDGVVDMEDSQGAFYGEERLRQLVSLPHGSAASMVESICSSLAAFRGEALPYDDVTLLAIRRH